MIAAIVAVAAPAAAVSAQVAAFSGEATTTAATIGSGSYADGEGWFIDELGEASITPLTALVQTYGALSDGMVRGHARIAATISAESISMTATARAQVGLGMVVESFSSSASMVATLVVAEDTHFFTRRTGTLPASLSAVTGQIDGAILRAGTYELAGFAWASRQFPGTTNLTGTYTIFLADCTADWNDDSVVSSADVAAYLDSWVQDAVSGGLHSDLNGDAQVTSADIAVFLGLWLPASVSGC